MKTTNIYTKVQKPDNGIYVGIYVERMNCELSADDTRGQEAFSQIQ